MFEDEPPEWFNLIEAARYLKVPPWELENRPVEWMSRAIEIMNAKAEADRQRERQHEERERIARGKIDD